ncbi:THAP domain-containing protein 9 [Plakobranchus ocellatus]|uniref:THAP domain-containing protein 9 n=1 Tax=Plakobranchus ocellatus TaxID=259542 RepID=A0AAV4DLD8_9GAST|nr:THAP domain-containing protein 9 [Plakobranchus ocellatus]
MNFSLDKYGRRYSEEMRSFAVILHFYSAQAYECLKIHLTLPNVSTIRRWSSSIDCEPGFFTEALDDLQTRKYSQAQMRDVCIMFDCMAIKKEFVFDSKTGKYSACVDFGSTADSSDHLPTEELVVMAVGLRSHCKQPIAYFLVDKICANVQSQIVKDAITHLIERGCLVHATVCDGCFSNQKTATQLGCILDVEKIRSTFQHPSYPGYICLFLMPAIF